GAAGECRRSRVLESFLRGTPAGSPRFKVSDEGHRGLGPVVDSELAIDARKVELHGVHRDLQLLRDVAVGRAVREPLEHGELARRQRRREGAVLLLGRLVHAEGGPAAVLQGLVQHARASILRSVRSAGGAQSETSAWARRLWPRIVWGTSMPSSESTVGATS